MTRGAPRLALDLIEEIDRVTHERGGGQWYLGLYVAELARTCAAAQEPGLAERLIEHAPTQAARHRDAHLAARAVLSEARDAVDTAAQLYDQAAERWARYGHVLEHGQALLGAGRCQLRLDRPHQARARLEEARAIFRGLGARPLSAAADACLLDARAQRR